MAFSASEAAFEGFRIIRREPLSVVAWAVVQLIFSAAVTALLLPMMGPVMAMGGLNAARGGASPAAVAAMAAVGRLYVVMIPIELIFFAILSAAVYRTVLRPGDKGLARLKLGGDELRLAGLFLLLVLLTFVVGIAAGIVAVLLGAGATMAAQSAPAVGGLLTFVIYLAFMAFFIWFGVRLSFAAPMTFARKRIRVFAAWPLTKGRFWSLFGAYLLAFVFIFIISMAFLALEVAVGLGAAKGSLVQAAAGVFRPDASSLQAYFSPVRLVLLPFSAALAAVIWTIGLAPAAKAYQEITGLSPETQADTFS